MRTSPCLRPIEDKKTCLSTHQLTLAYSKTLHIHLVRKHLLKHICCTDIFTVTHRKRRSYMKMEGRVGQTCKSMTSVFNERYTNSMSEYMAMFVQGIHGCMYVQKIRSATVFRRFGNYTPMLS